MIVKTKSGTYELLSESEHKLLGKHTSKKSAQKQETAIRLSKLRKQGRIK